jgi:hypothetical protein
MSIRTEPVDAGSNESNFEKLKHEKKAEASVSQGEESSNQSGI